MPSRETVMTVVLTRVHDRYAGATRGPSFLAQKIDELFDLANRWREAMLDEGTNRQENYLRCKALESMIHGLCQEWEDVDVHAVLDWRPEDAWPQVDIFFWNEEHGVTEINLFD